MSRLLRSVHIPQEVLEIILNGAVPVLEGQHLASLRLVSKAWKQAVDAHAVRIRPNEMWKGANQRTNMIADLCNYVKARFPAAVTLDLSRCYSTSVLVPAGQPSQLHAMNQLLQRLLATWPHEVVLRAGVRTIHTLPSHLFARVTGIHLVKDFSGKKAPNERDGQAPLQNHLELIFSKLPHLKEVCLEELEVGTLQANTSLSLLSNLTRLEFKGGILKELPTHLTALSALRTLHLHNCHLKVHSPKFKLGALLPSGIRSIVITHAHLAVNIPPPKLGKLTHLMHLDLSHNKVGALPSTIGELKQLEYLDMGYNSLVSVPESLSQLRGLKVLRLSHNKLRCLPKQTQKMIWLRTLDASYNAIVELPKGLHKLPELQWLDIRGNPLRVPLRRDVVHKLLLSPRLHTCLYDQHVAPARKQPIPPARPNLQPQPPPPHQPVQQQQEQEQAQLGGPVFQVLGADGALEGDIIHFLADLDDMSE